MFPPLHPRTEFSGKDAARESRDGLIRRTAVWIGSAGKEVLGSGGAGTLTMAVLEHGRKPRVSQCGREPRGAAVSGGPPASVGFGFWSPT